MIWLLYLDWSLKPMTITIPCRNKFRNLFMPSKEKNFLLPILLLSFSGWSQILIFCQRIQICLCLFSTPTLCCLSFYYFRAQYFCLSFLCCCWQFLPIPLLWARWGACDFLPLNLWCIVVRQTFQIRSSKSYCEAKCEKMAHLQVPGYKKCISKCKSNLQN